MSCGGDNYVVPGANPCNPGGGNNIVGVESINGEDGTIEILGGSGISVTSGAEQITISATGAGAGVLTLNTLLGALNITATNNSLVITAGGTSINLGVNFAFASVSAPLIVSGQVNSGGAGQVLLAGQTSWFAVDITTSTYGNGVSSRTQALEIVIFLIQHLLLFYKVILHMVLYGERQELHQIFLILLR